VRLTLPTLARLCTASEPLSPPAAVDHGVAKKRSLHWRQQSGGGGALQWLIIDHINNEAGNGEERKERASYVSARACALP